MAGRAHYRPQSVCGVIFDSQECRKITRGCIIVASFASRGTGRNMSRRHPFGGSAIVTICAGLGDGRNVSEAHFHEEGSKVFRRYIVQVARIASCIIGRRVVPGLPLGHGSVVASRTSACRNRVCISCIQEVGVIAGVGLRVTRYTGCGACRHVSRRLAFRGY
jgi:hypothetical protein